MTPQIKLALVGLLLLAAVGLWILSIQMFESFDPDTLPTATPSP